jgi:hypothetical protein
MYETIQRQLGPQLSASSTVNKEAALRWSTYQMPNPFAIVHVNSEEDVAATVQLTTFTLQLWLTSSPGQILQHAQSHLPRPKRWQRVG